MPEVPPPGNLLRDLRATSVWMSAEELQVYARCPPECRDRRGMQVGIIAAVVDSAGTHVAMTGAGDDRVAVSDMSYQPSGGVAEGPLVISTRLLRSGRSIIVVRSEVFDGRGDEVPARHAGSAVMTFTRTLRSADAVRPARPPAGERTTMADAKSGFEWPPPYPLGLEETAPGALVLPESVTGLTGFGTISGGVVAVTVTAAAESLVGAGTAADLSIRHMGQAGPGPLRTMARGSADHGTYTSVDVELLDPSNDDRVVALATVGVVAPD